MTETISIKEEARQLVERLPADATWDDDAPGFCKANDRGRLRGLPPRKVGVE
jgi:hypothetical protein